MPGGFGFPKLASSRGSLDYYEGGAGMPSNPFEDESGKYNVLVNHEEQYSLWPSWISIPDGWTVAFEDSRAACLAYIEENWKDMRPKSLRDFMSRGGS
jgi:MbtH protein